MRDFLLIGLGGAMGSMLRYGTGLLVGSKPFPLTTLLINVSGSLIIGLVMAYSLKNQAFAANWKLFLATGICGGFTTFSAFSLENLQLVDNGKFGMFAVYIAASVLLGLIAVWMGFKLISLVTD
ncbi:MAG: fluoride efflux transporter CrcB [Ferruginibacter sp.]|nr:fluoride efflux transporter CrcB [Ferruginibacter sp.]